MGRIWADIAIGFSVALLAAVAAIALRYLSPYDLLAEEFTWQQSVFFISFVLSLWVSHSSINEEDDAIRYVYAIACIIVGCSSALLLREGLLSGAIDYRLAGFALWLALLTAALWWTQVVDFWSERRPGSAAFLISFFATVVLGTYPALAWNVLMSEPLDLRSLRVDGEPLSVTATGVYDLIARSDIAVNWVVLLLSGAAAGGAYLAHERITTILQYLELAPEEVRRAKKWRRPAREAIAPEDRLDVLYPTKLRINTWEPPPELLINPAPTIVRMYLSSRTPRERMREIIELLAMHVLDTERTIVVIYQMTEGEGDDPTHGPPPARVLAYGLYSEFLEPFADDAFSDFLGANDAQGVQNYLNTFRNTLLNAPETDRPLEGDVLLATQAVSAALPLSDVLADMGEHRLRRILVVSDKEPFEYGVLSADKIASYISAH